MLPQTLHTFFINAHDVSNAPANNDDIRIQHVGNGGNSFTKEKIQPLHGLFCKRVCIRA